MFTGFVAIFIFPTVKDGIISIFFDMSILNCSTVIFPPEAAPLPRSLYVPGMFPGFLLQMLLKPYHGSLTVEY